MQFEEVVKKRLRGMAVRILANIEHTLGADLGDMRDSERFTLTGAEWNVIRSEILNAAGDTTRSLASLAGSSKPGKLSLSREVIAVINRAEVDLLKVGLGGREEVPIFKAYGDFNLLNKIRNEVGAGIVYKKVYTCAGLDNIVDSLMPFLDLAQIAGIKIADGEYKEWRDAVCEMYLEGLGDE
jgi:hypothetical protein